MCWSNHDVQIRALVATPSFISILVWTHGPGVGLLSIIWVEHRRLHCRFPAPFWPNLKHICLFRIFFNGCSPSFRSMNCSVHPINVDLLDCFLRRQSWYVKCKLLLSRYIPIALHWGKNKSHQITHSSHGDFSHLQECKKTTVQVLFCNTSNCNCVRNWTETNAKEIRPENGFQRKGMYRNVILLQTGLF